MRFDGHAAMLRGSPSPNSHCSSKTRLHMPESREDALCFCRLSTLVKSKSFNRKKQGIANKNFQTFPFDKTCNARLVAMMRYISKEHLFHLCCSNLRSKCTQIWIYSSHSLHARQRRQNQDTLEQDIGYSGPLCHKCNSAEELFGSHYFALIDPALNGLSARHATLILDFRNISIWKRCYVLYFKRWCCCWTATIDIVSATASYPELCAE